MNKKRLIITSVISIILVSVLLIGSTYSIFTSESVDEYANVYTTGILDVTYTVSSDNIKLEDATPIADKDNIYIKPYRLTITNNGSVPYNFNIILNNTTATTSIDSDYIMVQVGKLEPVVLGSTTNNIVKSDVIVEANSSVDIDVRVYIKEDIPNTEIGKNFSATLSIDGLAVYNDSGVINNDDLIAIYVYDSVLLSDYVKYLYSDGSSINTVNIGGNTSNPSVSLNATQGIMLDNNGVYRYYGANPNNYVEYNDELWRIISVENVKSSTSDTTGETRGKIIKADILTDDSGLDAFSWDSSDSTINSGYGVNDWSKSDLMTELNDLYYNSTSGTCYTGQNNATTACGFADTGLSSDARILTSDALYYLGGLDSGYSSFFANDFFTLERETIVYDCSTDDGACPRTTTWTGRVGIMYPSDYAYATDLSLCTVEPYNYESDENCYGNDWLLDAETNNAAQWVISPSSSLASMAFKVFSDGYVELYHADGVDVYVHWPLSVFPVQYLKSNVAIVDGQGTSDNPYKLSLEGNDDTEKK